MIFAFRLSPPYTNRRFSGQRQESYSSFSTPIIRFCPIIIPRFAHLSTFFREKGGFYPFWAQKKDFVFHKVLISVYRLHQYLSTANITTPYTSHASATPKAAMPTMIAQIRPAN